MSWLNEKACPVCKSSDFRPDCDEVDVGVGVMEGNRRGLCKVCGEVAQCDICGGWVSQKAGNFCVCDETR